MATLQNPQRVPLAKSADGKVTVYIEREWLRILLGQTGTSTPGSGSNITREEFDALAARVTALEDAVSTLQTAFAGLQSAVDALENFDPNSVLYDEQGRVLLDHQGLVLTSS
jgi:hypothetical protein